MKISKFFKKNEKVSVEQLAERHGELKAQLAELKSKEESLLQSALYDDAQNLAPQLADCRLQQELAQSALSEVRRRLKALLEAEIESDYAALPDMLADYESRLSSHLREAGVALGKAARLLPLSCRAELGTLAGGINQHVMAVRNSPRANELLDFLESFDSVTPLSAEMDFTSEKRRIERTENRIPGSPAAQNHVRHKIVELIGSEPESATPAGAPKAAVNERYIMTTNPRCLAPFSGGE